MRNVGKILIKSNISRNISLNVHVNVGLIDSVNCFSDISTIAEFFFKVVRPRAHSG